MRFKIEGLEVRRDIAGALLYRIVLYLSQCAMSSGAGVCS